MKEDSDLTAMVALMIYSIYVPLPQNKKTVIDPSIHPSARVYTAPAVYMYGIGCKLLLLLMLLFIKFKFCS